LHWGIRASWLWGWFMIHPWMICGRWWRVRSLIWMGRKFLLVHARSLRRVYFM